jgi:hypothetical protein
MTETILILASSIKFGGRCLAGKSQKTNQWVRVVGDANGAALTPEQTMYTNTFGSNKAKPLQRIDMILGQHVPKLHQPENYIHVAGWTQAYGYNVKLNELEKYADRPDSLWDEGDRVSEFLIGAGLITIPQSLYLVKVDDLVIRKVGDKRRVIFNYNGRMYNLAATDPNYDQFEAGHLVPNGFLCISLGEEFQGDHYKIVATIFGGAAQ